MQHPNRRALMCTAMAFAMVVAAAPSVAVGAPVTSPAIEAKKAEKKAALEEIVRMQEDLDRQVSEYVKLGRRLETARTDIDQVNLEIAEMDADLIRTQTALTERTIQLYRSDRLGLITLLLGSSTVEEFMSRGHYLLMVNHHDTQLIKDVRLARTESMWLQERLASRMAQLEQLQIETERRHDEIEVEIVAQQKKADEIGADLAQLIRDEVARQSFTGGEPDTAFDVDTVISDANFRASTSMTVADVQAFLDKQPGSLKSYRIADHNGQVVSVAEMIVEASTAHGISPKVILVKLQKEQSLLAKANPSQKALDWAMGCGATDSGRISKYKGFGNQIWYGARSLDQNAKRWSAGAQLKIDSSTIVKPTNSSTYALYKYTPHYAGTHSFWRLYWRYFGNPNG